MKKQVKKARQVISSGGIVIYPTETAYGIAADALNEKAIEKVYNAKQRPRSKGLTVIVDSLETAEKYAELTEAEQKIVEKFMPGPLTLVTEKEPTVPDNLNEKFVFRISSSKIARKLAEERPITATSANISGQKTSYSVKEIDSELEDQVDLVIDEGELEKSPTSSIIELKGGEDIIFHREGPITKEEVEALINDIDIHN